MIRTNGRFLFFFFFFFFFPSFSYIYSTDLQTHMQCVNFIADAPSAADAPRPLQKCGLFKVTLTNLLSKPKI